MSILNTCSGKRFLCLAGLLQASLLSAGNLFFNSGAEMGTAGFALWRLMNPKTNPEMRFSQPAADPENPFQGKYSLRIDNPFGEFFQLRTKRIHLPANAKVTIGCAMRGSEGVKKVILRAVCIDENGVWNMRSKVFPVAAEWKEFSFEFDTRKAAGEWQLQICQGAPGATTGSLWIDNIRVEKPGDAAASPALSIALVPEEKVLVFGRGEKKSAAVTAYLRNNSEKRLSGNAVFDMTGDQTGEVVQSGTLPYDLAPGEVLKTTLRFTLSRYGAFRIVPRRSAIAAEHLDALVCAVGKYVPGEKLDPMNDFCTAIVNAGEISFYNGNVCRLGVGDSPEEKYRLLELMGCRLVRTMAYPVTDWRLVEPQEGKFDFSEMDYWTDVAAKHHVSLMPCFGQMMEIKGQNNTPYPRWLAEKATLIEKNPAGTHPKFTVRVPSEELFDRYVRAFVRYAGKRIRLYEFMNEPNLFMSPELYSRYLAAAYRAMKEENPEAMMLGICVTGDMGGIVQGYLRGCVKAGALDNLDAVSFHPYNARTLSSVTPADEQIAEIRKIVKGKPLFNTELFFLYDRDDQDRSFSAQSNAHPHHLAQRILTDLGEGVRQSMDLYENQLWTQMLSSSHNPHGIDSWTPNSIFVALNALSRHFEGAKPVKKYKSSNGLVIYRFERNGKPLAAMWQYRPTGKMTINLSGMELHDVLGNPVASGFVPVTANPVYCQPGSLTAEEFRKRLEQAEIRFEQPVFSPVARKIGDRLFFRIGNISQNRENVLTGLKGGLLRAKSPLQLQLASQEFRNESLAVTPGVAGKPLFHFFKFGDRIGQSPCRFIETATVANGGKMILSTPDKTFSSEGSVTLAGGNVVCEFRVKDAVPSGPNAGREAWQCDGLEFFFDRAPEQMPLPHAGVYTPEVFRFFINPYDTKPLTLLNGEGIGLQEKECKLKVKLENGGYRIRLEFPLKYGKWLGFAWKANNAAHGKQKMQSLEWGTPGSNDFFQNRLAFGCVSSESK